MGAVTTESVTEANRALVTRFWEDLYRHDFDACGAYFTDDGVYTDVPEIGRAHV